MEKPTIRELTEEAVPAVAALSKRCFSLPWTEEGYRLEMRKPGSLCLTAYLDKELVGFLCLSSVLEEAELCLLAVLPERRRRGIAAELLLRCLELCRERGIAVIHLEVRASNQGAIQLYGHFGFVQDGLRRNYYRLPQEDAVLYSLRLEEDFEPPLLKSTVGMPEKEGTKQFENTSH